MGRQDWDSPLPIQSFSENYREALNCSQEIDLKQLIFHETKEKGDAHWIQSYKAKGKFDENTGTFVKQAALDRPAGAIPRRMWEALKESDRTFAAWMKRITPHQDIDFYMTLCDKQETETGHEFENRDKLDMINDPTNPTLRLLADGFIVKSNQRVLDAITASTTVRKMLDMNNASENFGKVVMKTENWKDNNPYAEYETEFEGYLSIFDDMPELEARLEACAVPHGMRKIILINTFDVALIKKKNKEALFNNQFPFVTAEDVRSGNLPEIFGFSWVKTRQVPRGTMIGFVPEAISMVPYLDLEQSLDTEILMRNHIFWYAHEEYGFVRNDDMGAFVIKYKQPAASGGSGGGSAGTEETDGK